MDSLKLLPGLRARGFHSSLATTYSVDGAFYDGAVQHRLYREGCLNNILVADAAMLADALEALPEAFARAGRRYAVVPARVRGCFHPKILLRLGDRRARLQVASANVTAAGWCRNAELGCDISYEARPDAEADNAAYGRLVRKAYDYLLHWLVAVPGEAIEAKVRGHRHDAPWLDDLSPANGPAELADGSLADLLLERGDGRTPGILEQFVELVGGSAASVRRAVVSSPYWDVDARALCDLQDALGGAPIVVALPMGEPGFPEFARIAGRDVRFAALPAHLEPRFVHAKLAVIEADDSDHVLFGSANISRAALGGLGGVAARNAEACVYRRLPPGRALAYLGLDLSRPIDRAKLRGVRPEPSGSGSEARPLPGVAEIDGRTLTWWPPAGVSPVGATLLLGPAELPVVPSGNAQGLVILASPPAARPLIVRFRLGDGRETPPVIVHDPDSLRQSSPRSFGPWSSTVQRFERGTDDLLELAVLADHLFGTSDVPGQGRGRGRDADDTEQSTEYRDEAEFRHETEDVAARERRAIYSSGPAGGSWLDDPILALCARIAIGCLTGESDPRQERKRELEEEQDAEAGEEEDGSADGGAGLLRPGGGDGDRATPQERTLSTSNADRGDDATRDRTARRRRRFAHALKRFELWLAATASNPGLPADDVPAKVAFMLRLMHEAALLPAEAGGPLISILPEGKRRDDCVAVRAMKALQAVWAGQPRVPPIAQRLDPDPPRAREKLNAVAFAQFSRWAATRCLMAVEDGGTEHAALARLLAPVAGRVAAATLLIAPSDAEEHTRFTVLEAALGGDARTAARFISRVGSLCTIPRDGSGT